MVAVNTEAAMVAVAAPEEAAQVGKEMADRPYMSQAHC